MPNSGIFCNSAWYELQIYWDGSLGICCQESQKLYRTEDSDKFNIKYMTVAEWFNSEPVKQFRQTLLGDHRIPVCSKCYQDDDFGSVSRRVRSNQKSVIFPQAFDSSYAQSPGRRHFEYSQINLGHHTKRMPVDLHIDLGNYCNLACKMCHAGASSTIAQQEVLWGISESRRFLGVDWTRDSKVWHRFKQEIISLPELNNIHFMGGETLLTDRFSDLVDSLIDAGRTDVCLSFVTNGTVFAPDLVRKLAQFRRVGFEVSLETVDDHNSYIRQGTDTKKVLTNIDRYLENCNGTNITLTLRPAPSILSVGYLMSLIKFAYDRQLIIKSNTCYNPAFMRISNLPKEIRLQYQRVYWEYLDTLPDSVLTATSYNASDPNNYLIVIRDFVRSILLMLDSGLENGHTENLRLLTKHCEKWDRVYGHNALVLYPEWQFLRELGYDVSS